MRNLLKSRLKKLVDESGKSPRAISMKATGKPDVVRDILGDRIADPGSLTLRRLAQTLGVDVAYLVGESDLRRKVGNNTTVGGLVPVRVVGYVQAGAFMELADHIPDGEGENVVAAVKDQEFPDLEPVAFEVVGDSINQVCQPGGYAICLNFAETGLQIRDGMWVVAERCRGNMIERTVKQVRRSTGGVELHPASTNPAHKPIRFPSAEPHEEVRVVAIVRRFLSPTLPL